MTTLDEIEAYCKYYNIPMEHLLKVMSDLKVIPMLRGKGFEYFVTDRLKHLLPASRWIISNPNINAQSEIHDVDVEITRKRDNKKVRIECKLSDKGSFTNNDSPTKIQVKCMRSRTISDNEMATRMATRYGVTREMILIHADQYRKIDFDIVVTTLGNALWTTHEDGRYVFDGDVIRLRKLAELFPSSFSINDDLETFKDKAFSFLLFAQSNKLTANHVNGVLCRRRRCIAQHTNGDCGFIPNYPMINLNEVAAGTSAWKPLNAIETELNTFLDSQN